MAKSIDFTDYSQNNLDEVGKWIVGSPDAFNWDQYIRTALELEDTDNTDAAVVRRKATIRRKITSLARLNILDSKQILTGKQPYGVVSAVFCTDAITHSVSEWQSVLKNITQLVQGNGHLILVGVFGSSSWSMGSETFKATDLNKDIIVQTIEDLGYAIEIFESVLAESDDHGYDGVFFMKARKKT